MNILHTISNYICYYNKNRLKDYFSNNYNSNYNNDNLNIDNMNNIDTMNTKNDNIKYTKKLKYIITIKMVCNNCSSMITEDKEIFCLNDRLFCSIRCRDYYNNDKYYVYDCNDYNINNINVESPEKKHKIL